jgi:Holliday junction resolvase RusA-like endonuclease
MNINNSIEIIIPGQPLAKQRSRKGGYGNWYNPQEKEMNIARRIIKEQLPESFTMIEKNVPVIVGINFFFAPPKTTTKSLLQEIENNDMIPYLKRFDLDNLEKFILDCMSKIVFYDDAQVFSETLAKYYAMPGTEKTIITVEW